MQSQLDPSLSYPRDRNADCTREGLLSPNVTCTCREPFTVGDRLNCSSMLYNCDFCHMQSQIPVCLTYVTQMLTALEKENLALISHVHVENHSLLEMDSIAQVCYKCSSIL